MIAPKIAFKKVKTFQGMEGYGLNCDLYINGVKCLFVLDEGNGGEMNYTTYEHQAKTEAEKRKIKDLIQQLNDYIKTLPDVKSDLGDKTFTYKPDLDWFVNDLLEKQEIEKNMAKLKKLFTTAIVFGVPNGDKYSYIDYKKPLESFSKQTLQSAIANIKFKYCKDGVQILNTNLNSLGITL